MARVFRVGPGGGAALAPVGSSCGAGGASCPVSSVAPGRDGPGGCAAGTGTSEGGECVSSTGTSRQRRYNDRVSRVSVIAQRGTAYPAKNGGPGREQTARQPRGKSQEGAMAVYFGI